MKFLKNIIIFILVIFLYSCNKSTDSLNAFFFDVNQGDSSFVSYKNISILIDTGEEKYSHNVVDFLKSKKLKSIDYVILSHDHSDHVSGFKNIIKNFKIKNIILPDVMRNETFNEIKLLTKNSNTKLHYIKSPKTLKLLDNFSLKFFNNFDEVPEEFNDTSLVFKLSVNDFDILYTGDVEEYGQLKLMNSNLKSEVIKVPHHGAFNNDKNNVEKFLTKVSPLISVISVGNNSYGHPNKNTLSLLENLKSKILRTDEMGTIQIVCDFQNQSLSIREIF